MKDLLRCIIFFILSSLSLNKLTAQESSVYPHGYFRDPLEIPIQLVSNFGELRSNHFHMGLDIRTESRENLRVHAAADGYISRIKIERYGFGNAIYIAHPNGYTTLYAHLNAFYPALAEYVKAKQYREQKWEQDFELPAGLFPVKKGQFIALSGNTGGSAGPHLHFEIRDTKTGNNLNPLLFGLPVPDTRDPVIRAIYWYDRRYSTYITDAKPIPIIKKTDGYTSSAKVVKVSSPLISFAIGTEDLSNSSGFNLGVYKGELYVDDSLANAFTLDDFSYTDTRYVNACIDYEMLMARKRYAQYLAVLPGNKMNIFTPTPTNGLIILTDTLPHNIRIKVADAYGNAAQARLTIQLGNVDPVQRYPDDAQPLLPNRENSVGDNNVKVNFKQNAFYDVVPFVLSEKQSTNKNSASELVSLYKYTVPVHNSYTVRLKTNLAPDDALRQKVVMQLKSGSTEQLSKGDWAGDWMSGTFNKLGDVQLLVDTLPPLIRTVGWKSGSLLSTARHLIVKCMDNLHEIASFRAELDGQWLLFVGAKSDNFIYTFDEHCKRGAHSLKISVTDLAGNETIRTFTFRR